MLRAQKMQLSQKFALEVTLNFIFEPHLMSIILWFNWVILWKLECWSIQIFTFWHCCQKLKILPTHSANSLYSLLSKLYSRYFVIEVDVDQKSQTSIQQLTIILPNTPQWRFAYPQVIQNIFSFKYVLPQEPLIS